MKVNGDVPEERLNRIFPEQGNDRCFIIVSVHFVVEYILLNRELKVKVSGKEVLMVYVPE